MPAGQIIGRVAIKVLPDTDDFRRRTERYLDKLEDSGALNAKVRLALDATGLRRRILETVRDINRENRLQAVRKIKFYADVDASTLGTKVRVEVDRDSMRRTEDDLEDWRRRQEPLKIRVTPHMPLGPGAFVEKRLDYLTRPRFVPIFPILNGTAFNKVATAIAALSGARMLDNIFTKITDKLKNLDKNLPIIGTISLAIAGLAGFSLTAASNLAALSYTLAQIASVSLALPGIFGGMAIGLGATFAVFKDFNEVIPELATELSRLQDQMSERFWREAEQPIRNLIDTLLPQFKAGLRGTADSLGIYFSGLAKGLEGSLDGALQGMFDDLHESIEIAAGGTDALANVIKVLGEVGAGYLPRLADWFIDISDQFSNWLTATQADGRLQGWIDAGIDALTDLGRALSGIGSIFAGIGRAAAEAGGSTIGMFADTLERVAAVVNGPVFQEALTGTFAAAHEAMSLIAENSGPQVQNFFLTLGKLLEEILPIAGEGIGIAFGAIADALSQPVVSESLVTFFTGLRDAIVALAPSMPALAQGLAAVFGALGPVAAAFGDLGAAAIVPFAEAIQALAPALVPVVELLSGTLVGLLESVGPAFVTITQAFADLLSGGLLDGLAALIEPLVPIIGEMVAAFADLATQVLPILGPVLAVLGESLGKVLEAAAPLIPIFLELLTSILVPLVEAFAPLAESLLPLLADAFVAIAEAVTPVILLIAELVKELLPILIPIITFVVQFLAETVVGVIEGIAKVISGVFTFITETWNAFAALFRGDWEGFWNGIKAAFAGLWEAIKGIIQVALNVGILKVIGKGLTLLKGLWGNIWNGIKNVALTLWNILKERWTTFLTALKNSPKNALTAIKNLFKNIWDDIKAIFEFAWTAITVTVRLGVGAVIRFVTGIPGRIANALSNIGSTLVNAGRRLIEGFINGIASMFNAVKNKLGELTSKLFSWKGPPGKDAVLLYDAGRLVIGGFIDGIRSQFGAVRDTLQELTRDVGATVIEPPRFEASKYTSSLADAVDTNVNTEGPVVKVLQYNAAPNQSLSAEDELFAASNRARMVDW